MTSTTKKVVASTATAVAVATGVIVSTYDAYDPSIDWNSVVPNIEQYTPQIPDMEYEKIVPKIDLGLNLLKNEEEFSDNSISFESNQTLTYGNSDDTSFYEDIQSIEIDKDANIAKITFKVPGMAANGCRISSLTIPLGDYDLDLINQAIKWKKIQEYFKDKRNVDRDINILTNVNINQWLKIYDNYKSIKFLRIPTYQKFRMISEINLPKNSLEFEILNKNLDYYRFRGYDSVLIVFDGSESPRDLNYLVKYVRYKGFRSFFAFGGEESLNVSVFVNSETLKKQLQALAQFSEGFLLAWRRTSAHLIEQDIEYMNYMSSCVREINKNCLIFGEVYYGNTAKYPHEHQWGFGYNLPNYASGAVICNFGVESVNADGVVKYLIPHKIGKTMSQVAVITGQKPYYLTIHRNNLSQEENQKIKEKLEKRFIKAGCKGTITLHDDGRNGIGGYRINNNLSQTLYSELN